MGLFAFRRRDNNSRPRTTSPSQASSNTEMTIEFEAPSNPPAKKNSLMCNCGFKAKNKAGLTSHQRFNGCKTATYKVGE